ncbi:MAG: TRAP transporter small permease [Deltaproteobacteria bacterium]|nr:TRAP transporter small permease [Deltaproteobacteria bacterium]
MQRILTILNKLEELTLGVGLLALAGMAFVEVVLRYLFNFSFTWFEELSRYAGVFLTFLGASLGVKYGTHFTMDFFVQRAGPRTAHLMRLAAALLGAGLFFLVAWLAWLHAWKLRRYGVTSAALGLPMFWAYLPISVFSFTLALRLLNQARREWAGFWEARAEDNGSGGVDRP